MNRGLVNFLLSPRAWGALLSWPQFSITSFNLVSALKKQGVAPKTVIDVGANCGQFTVACAKLYPGLSLHAFEPLPEAVKALRRNVAKLPRVQVHQLALGDKCGEIRFFVNSHSHSSSALALGARHRKAFPQALEVGSILVDQSTLDGEFGNLNLVPPVLLKLDVQGYEATVLRGAVSILRRVDLVLLETSFEPMYDGELNFLEMVKFMESHGFDFLRPVSYLEDPGNGEILQADVLFARRPGEQRADQAPYS